MPNAAEWRLAQCKFASGTPLPSEKLYGTEQRPVGRRRGSSSPAVRWAGKLIGVV